VTTDRVVNQTVAENVVQGDAQLLPDDLRRNDTWPCDCNRGKYA